MGMKKKRKTGLLKIPSCNTRCIVWKKVHIETTPQEVLAIIGVEAVSHPSPTFSNEELTPEGITHIRSLQITIECMGAKVSMVLVDNGFTPNVCPFRTALKVGLDIETNTPSSLWAQAPVTIYFSHPFGKYTLAE
ncbi:hypothetical protein SO802_002706 [Lithocarpus litseifolius]|uniref:Uncharacterized protein n=1 Tax=Lithocarpus litseifolius TaxID=425828 RepID=A0AAW2DXZ5_9ROSI